MDIFLRIAAIALGWLLGNWARRRDLWASVFGIGLGLSIAQAISDRDPWFLLGIPVFGALLGWRRAAQRKAAPAAR